MMNNNNFCAYPFTSVTITASGRVVPCCNDYDQKYVLGDLNSQTLLEIWNGERMKTLRHEFKTGIITNPLCRDCKTKKDISFKRKVKEKLRFTK